MTASVARNVPGSPPSVCRRCGYDRSGLAPGVLCPECGAPAFNSSDDEAQAIDHSVWDEPALRATLAGAAPATDIAGGTASAYAVWITGKRAQTPWITSWLAVLGIAMLAGPWAVLGAFWGSGESILSIVSLVIVGPTIEEIMKVGLLTYVIERRAYLLKSGTQVILCALAGGVAFAAIENVMYLLAYSPDAPPNLVLWRWTACVALHAVCSVICGIGLYRVWSSIWSRGERPELTRAFPFTLAAIILHGLFNGGVIIAEEAGVLAF